MSYHCYKYVARVTMYYQSITWYIFYHGIVCCHGVVCVAMETLGLFVCRKCNKPLLHCVLPTSISLMF